MELISGIHLGYRWEEIDYGYLFNFNIRQISAPSIIIEHF